MTEVKQYRDVIRKLHESVQSGSVEVTLIVGKGTIRAESMSK